ncbi:hypothetical protein V2J09_003769, partial [Rumex salicifolius]
IGPTSTDLTALSYNTNGPQQSATLPNSPSLSPNGPPSTIQPIISTSAQPTIPHPTPITQQSVDATTSPNSPLLTYNRRAKPTAPPILPTRAITRSNNNITKPIQTINLHVQTTLPTLPTTITHALKNPIWRDAMQREFEALCSNITWDLVPSQSTQNLVGCRWVYKVKTIPDGSLDKFKARSDRDMIFLRHIYTAICEHSVVVRWRTSATLSDVVPTNHKELTIPQFNKT